MDQLGIGAGEFQVMRLAGLSDAIILEAAKHQAEGKPSLSGLSLGGLKNSGLRESTLLELDSAECRILRPIKFSFFGGIVRQTRKSYAGSPGASQSRSRPEFRLLRTAPAR